MTDEEKAKLYKAIGYEEAGAVSRLPKEVSYVAAQALHQHIAAVYIVRQFV